MRLNLFFVWLIVADPAAAALYEIAGPKNWNNSRLRDSILCPVLDGDKTTECRTAFNGDFVRDDLQWRGSYVYVDLNGYFSVKKVVFWPSVSNPTLSRGIHVYVSRTSTILNEVLFYRFDSMTMSADKYVAVAEAPVWARYVTFYKFAVKDEDMAISEVLIYTDYKYTGLIQSPARLFQTRQNHTWLGKDKYVAHAAVDGLTTTCSFTAQDDVTKKGEEVGSWTVDLLTSTEVEGVSVTNGDIDIDIHRYRYFAYLSIYVHEAAEPTPNDLCYDLDEAPLNEAGVPVTILCARSTKGRYLTVRRKRESADVWKREDALAICELLVLVSFEGSAEPAEQSATSPPYDLTTLIVGCVLGCLVLVLVILLVVLATKYKMSRKLPDENCGTETSPYNVYVKDNPAFVENLDEKDKSKSKSGKNTSSTEKTARNGFKSSTDQYYENI